MKAREWARRRGGKVDPTSPLAQLLDEAVVSAADYSPVWLEGVRSFYDYLHEGDGTERICTGTACHFARQEPAVQCLGRCYEAPARSSTTSAPVPRSSLVAEPVVLRHLVEGARPEPDLEDASLPDPAAILEAVTASGLRGRGGAAFPTAAKWRAARDTPAVDRYVVANGDEGDPGSSWTACCSRRIRTPCWPACWPVLGRSAPVEAWSSFVASTRRLRP